LSGSGLSIAFYFHSAMCRPRHASCALNVAAETAVTNYAAAAPASVLRRSFSLDAASSRRFHFLGARLRGAPLALGVRRCLDGCLAPCGLPVARPASRRPTERPTAGIPAIRVTRPYVYDFWRPFTVDAVRRRTEVFTISCKPKYYNHFLLTVAVWTDMRSSSYSLP